MASNASRTLLKAVTCLLEFEETISPNFFEHPVIVLIKKIGMAMYKGQYLLTLRAARNDKAFINFFECGSYKKWAILSQHSASKVQFWFKNSIWFKYLQKSQFEFYCQNVFFFYLNDFELQCLSCKIVFQPEIQFATFFARFTLVQIHIHKGNTTILPKCKLQQKFISFHIFLGYFT